MGKTNKSGVKECWAIYEIVGGKKIMFCNSISTNTSGPFDTINSKVAAIKLSIKYQEFKYSQFWRHHISHRLRLLSFESSKIIEKLLLFIFLFYYT